MPKPLPTVRHNTVTVDPTVQIELQNGGHPHGFLRALNKPQRELAQSLQDLQMAVARNVDQC